jgi:hypothetical protein
MVEGAGAAGSLNHAAGHMRMCYLAAWKPFECVTRHATVFFACADLRRKWFQDNSECSSEASTEGGRLNMSQAWSVFVIPAVGAAAGILIAAAEVFYYNKMFVGRD